MQAHTEKYKGYDIEIYYDEDPENPREWDKLGTMALFHNKYVLGDKVTFHTNDFDGWDEMMRYIIKTYKPVIIKPVYLYDHSGITISTTPFGCSWDSGKIGFYYFTRKQAMDIFGWKRITAKRSKRINKLMEGRLDIYDSYLRGEVFYFHVEYNDETLDGCSGYYREADAIDEAKGVIDHDIKYRRNERTKQLKTWVLNKVPYNNRIYKKEK